MKFINVLTTSYLLLAMTETIAYSLEQYINDINGNSSAILLRVKRRGFKRGSGRKAKNYNSYPKQPVQTGYNPSQVGHYPGQNGHYLGQQSAYGHHGYGHNGGGMLAKNNIGQSKGMSSLSAGVLGGVGGAALGAYGGYKLGKMVGGLGMKGHYGYIEQNRYIKCDPPPKIEIDLKTNITYIPMNVTYDARCVYHERDPSTYYNRYNSSQRMYYMSRQSTCIPSMTAYLTPLFTPVLVYLFGFNTGFADSSGYSRYLRFT